MAASDHDTSFDRPAAGAIVCLSPAALHERLAEEINRAARHDTSLSCLLVTIGNLDELIREHGAELAEQTLAYIARAIGSQVRDFDRIGRPSAGELVLLLPGADGPRGEIVARRALQRLRTIKVEADGARRPLSVSVGLAAWEPDLSGEDLLERAREAARRGYGNGNSGSQLSGSSPPALGRPHGPA
jgi:diguanylate cyclase (GGDEF)-like protein